MNEKNSVQCCLCSLKTDGLTAPTSWETKSTWLVLPFPVLAFLPHVPHLHSTTVLLKTWQKDCTRKGGSAAVWLVEGKCWFSKWQCSNSNERLTKVISAVQILARSGSQIIQVHFKDTRKTSSFGREGIFILWQQFLNIVILNSFLFLLCLVVCVCVYVWMNICLKSAQSPQEAAINFQLLLHSDAAVSDKWKGKGIMEEKGEKIAYICKRHDQVSKMLQ